MELKENWKDPVNGLLFWDVVELILNRHTVRVVLEPGDATRYELLLVPQINQLPQLTLTGNADHVIVVRQTGSRLTVANIPIRSPLWEGEVRPISNNNEHTVKVLTAWLEALFTAILDWPE